MFLFVNGQMLKVRSTKIPLGDNETLLNISLTKNYVCVLFEGAD